MPTPILWQAPPVGSNLDLTYGIGGQIQEPRPDEQSFSFVQVAGGGESNQLQDDLGRRWMLIAQTNVARAETVASRFAWACGYHCDQVYVLPQLRVYGQGGRDFNDVALKRVELNHQRIGHWEWNNSSLSSKPEFSGLKALMAFLGNWGTSTEANWIIRNQNDDLIHYVSGFGSTLGRPAANRNARTRANAQDYNDQRFIEGVIDGKVKFQWPGPGRDVIEGVKPEDTLWLANLLSQIPREQIVKAFEAARFSAAETNIYHFAVRRRIQQLTRPDFIIYRWTSPIMIDERIRAIQLKLQTLGFDPIEIDGKFGPHTFEAVKQFQANRGLETHGELWANTTEAIEQA